MSAPSLDAAAATGVLTIGIAGGSASGKSFFCRKLAQACEGICWCAVITHDDYYKDQAQVDEECDGNWDCPEALHTEELAAHLRELKRGRSVLVPHYDFSVSRRIPEKAAEVTPPSGELVVILVEGLMVFYSDEVCSLLDLRLFVDCDEDTRFMRRLARDTGWLQQGAQTVSRLAARNPEAPHTGSELLTRPTRAMCAQTIATAAGAGALRPCTRRGPRWSSRRTTGTSNQPSGSRT